MTTDGLPDPLVPLDYDVSMLSDFRLNVDRLLASELVAVGTAEECWAALMLWCRAWKQVPGGSLPNDERTLAGFSGAGSRWKRVREVALRGFILCSDGRLYHRFLCEEVRRAYKSHIANIQRRDADRKRLSEWRSKRTKNGNETSDETRFVAEEPEPEPTSSLRSEVSDAIASGASAPTVDPTKAIFDRGVAILGDKRRSLLAKLCKQHGEPAVLEAIVACEFEQPVEPASFLLACLARAGPKTNGNNVASPVENLYLGAMRAADKFDEIDRQQGNRGDDFPPARPLLGRH